MVYKDIEGDTCFLGLGFGCIVGSDYYGTP